MAGAFPQAALCLSSIVKISSQPLRPSPYQAYRDPKTGQWLIAKQGQDNYVVNAQNSAQNNDKNA